MQRLAPCTGLDKLLRSLDTLDFGQANAAVLCLWHWSELCLCYCLVVDRIPRIVVLDLVGPVGAIVGIKTTGGLNC